MIQRMKNHSWVDIACILCVLSMFSCNFPSQKFIDKEREKLEKCRSNWTFRDLDTVIQVKAELFQEKGVFHMRAHPNFVIGRLQDGTYVGILDKEYTKIVKIGTALIVKPDKWSDLDKARLKPQFLINKNSLKNDLYCKIKIIFYGKIK